MADETPVDIAYNHATDSLTGQRARLDNLRTRAVAVVTAASVIASFLGGQALADTQTARGGTGTIADRSLQSLEVVGFLAFIAAFVLSALIVSPKTEAWKFRMKADVLLEDWATDDGDSQLMKRDLAGRMESYYGKNEAKMKRLFKMLQGSFVLLAVEAAAFMLDLAI